MQDSTAPFSFCVVQRLLLREAQLAEDDSAREAEVGEVGERSDGGLAGFNPDTALAPDLTSGEVDKLFAATKDAV